MNAEPLKISSELRNIAVKSIDQARTAFGGFVEAAQNVASGADRATVELHSDVKALGSKAIGYGEQNVKSALDLAQKLAESTTPEEALKHQSEYLKTQIAVMQEQAKDLGSSLKATAEGLGSTVKNALNL
jgi:phasin